MESISIKNLRSIQDSGELKIKPLTILLGKNSSGKSTLLRFFPLMKQTINSRRNEAVLWYNNESVDFGNFDKAINKNANPKVLEMSFEFLIPKNHLNFSRFHQIKPNKETIKTNVDVKIKQNQFENIKISIEDINFIMQIGKNKKMKINTNKSNYVNEFRVDMVFEKEEFFPEFYINNNGILKDSNFLEKIFNEFFKEDFKDNNIIVEELFKKDFKDNSIIIDENGYRKKINNTGKEDFVKFFPELLSFIRLSDYKELFIDDVKFWAKLTSKLNDMKVSIVFRLDLINFITKISKLSNENKDQLYSLMLLSNLPNILRVLNSEISSYFLGVKYIAPLRANVQRYYRENGISVDDIDSQGVNMPMILKDLSPSKRENFENWTYENFGFSIGIEPIQDHISLVISFSKDKKNEKLNLADVGFGFSQILPIIYTLWSNTENTNSSISRNMYTNTKIQSHILIEQPELHLHPAMQAKLVDAFLKCINLLHKRNKDFSIIIETHSEIIVNRIGKMIYEGSFNKDLCNVLIFGGDINNSSIKAIEYDKEGILKEWPLGFFQPDSPELTPEFEFNWEEEEKKQC